MIAGILINWEQNLVSSFLVNFEGNMEKGVKDELIRFRLVGKDYYRSRNFRKYVFSSERV